MLRSQPPQGMRDPRGTVRNKAIEILPRRRYRWFGATKTLCACGEFAPRFLPRIWPGNLAGELLLGFPTCCRHVRGGRASPFGDRLDQSAPAFTRCDCRVPMNSSTVSVSGIAPLGVTRLW